MKDILIIDKDMSIPLQLSSKFENIYHVDSFINGKLGFEHLKVRKIKPVIILINLEAEETSGMEMFAKIKDDSKLRGIPIIFMSSSNDPSIELEALAQGVNDFLHLPIHINIIISRIKFHLELKSQQEKLEHDYSDLVQVNKRISQRYAELSNTMSTIGVKNVLSENVIFEHFVTDLILDIVKAKCIDVYNHLIRTSEFLKLFIQCLCEDADIGLSTQEIEYIVICSKMFDAGLILLDNSYFEQKGSNLHKDPRYKDHPTQVSDLIAKHSGIIPNRSAVMYAYQMARYHHENWDGSGFPGELSGKKIPLTARLLAIVNTYDTLLFSRNKPDFEQLFNSHNNACDYIETYAGIEFDPYLSNIFKSYKMKFLELAQTFL